MPVLSNPKHESVAQAFIRDPARIGWHAYKAVFTGCSDRAAQTAWSRLLKKPEFSARVDELLASAADASVMELREVLQELSNLGRANMRDFVQIGLADDLEAAIAGLTPQQSAAIQEITVESYDEPGEADEKLEDQPHGGKLKRRAARQVKRIKFKLHSKHAALAELRAHHEPQRHEHTGAGGGPIEKKTAEGELDLVRRIAFALESAARKAPAPAPAAPAKPKPKPKR